MGSDGPTQNNTYADSRLSNKLENFDSRMNIIATPSVKSSYKKSLKISNHP